MNGRWQTPSLLAIGLGLGLGYMAAVGLPPAQRPPTLSSACGPLQSSAAPMVVTADGARCIAPFPIRIPETVSVEAQAFLADTATDTPIDFSLPDAGNTIAWALATKLDAKRNRESRESLLARYPVDAVDSVIAGARVTKLTPSDIASEHRHRLLINIHGGAYVLGRGDIVEAIQVAHHGKIRVLAVDYRMPPSAPYPAALEDIVAVYREVIKQTPPQHIALFGTSAGGGLTAAATLMIRDRGLPLPGAVGLLSPSADFVRQGDSRFSNRYLDKILPNALGDTVRRLYVAEHAPESPYISPVYADFSAGFPPAYLLSGTRDLLLSDTVRLHRALRGDGVHADLHVFEGMPHAFQVIDDTLPESREAIQGMMAFFQHHLAP